MNNFFTPFHALGHILSPAAARLRDPLQLNVFHKHQATILDELGRSAERRGNIAPIAYQRSRRVFCRTTP
jgi:hypothetical protein